VSTTYTETEGEESAGPSASIPPYVEKRIQRGRARMKKRSALRRLFYRFWRGETYWDVNDKGILVSQSTITTRQGGKPPHRIRNRYPFIAMIIGAKVSAATQRTPGYEVIPSTTEPGDAQAAALSEKVSLFGYDKWRLRRARVKAVEHALVGGEGFFYPYFDNTIGPYIDVTDPKTGESSTVGQGDVAVKVLSGNEVYWEEGVDFDVSRWHAIEQALPVDVVKEMSGYIAGELAPNATDSESPADAKENLVVVTEYFERPCPDYREGRKLTFANKRQIFPEEAYPLRDHEDNVVDEPVPVRISYIVECDDRDRGLVELLVDLQRTIQDCWNKLLEWKNRCLNPQMTAPRGANMARRDDTPGATWLYNAVAGLKPEWERPPAIPRELFMILDKALEHMRAIAADVDVQPDPRLTSETAQTAVQQAQMRWGTFLGDLAEADSHVMRRCLWLVQRHYTEPRLIKIQGLFGPDLTVGFLGADLLGQADVRVSKESLETRSREAVQQETLLFADRGWISPQAAMAVIQGGVAENLWKAWLFDVGRANTVIQTIKRGPEALFALPDRPAYPGEEPPVDPNTGAADQGGPQRGGARARLHAAAVRQRRHSHRGLRDVDEDDRVGPAAGADAARRDDLLPGAAQPQAKARARRRDRAGCEGEGARRGQRRQAAAGVTDARPAPARAGRRATFVRGAPMAGYPRKPALGSGKRFAALEQSLAGRAGVSDPRALAAAIGRKKYGSGHFAQLSAKGRKRHHKS
jgi:hypothetical protein